MEPSKSRAHKPKPFPLLGAQKGVQSIITAFFLVVVFVTVLLLLIYFNYEGVVKKQALSQSYDFFQQNAGYTGSCPGPQFLHSCRRERLFH
jgi:hypothetical protein